MKRKHTHRQEEGDEQAHTHKQGRRMIRRTHTHAQTRGEEEEEEMFEENNADMDVEGLLSKLQE